MRQLQAKLSAAARASMAKMKRNRAKAQAWLKHHYGIPKNSATAIAKRK